MASHDSAANFRRWFVAALSGFGSLVSFGTSADHLYAQQDRKVDVGALTTSGEFAVRNTHHDLSMVVNSSQMLTAIEDIKLFTVHNPDVLSAQPIESNKVQISARRTGVTQVDLITGDDKTYSVQVMVVGDVRELEIVLRQTFPTSQLKVTPVQNGCIVTGVVTNSDDVDTAIQIAELYFPKVVNSIQVIGVHQVLLHTQVMEVSRSKLRNLGIDWGLSNQTGDFVVQSVSGIMPAASQAAAGAAGAAATTGTNTVSFGVVGSNTAFFGLVRALRQNNLIKVLADPTVVAIDGRPASFNSGGEFPIVVPQGLGTLAIEYREFGTRIDFVAKVRDKSRISLEVRPTISEIDPSRSVTINGIQVPGLRSRFVDTAVELNAGQTLAIAGLLQVRTEAENAGIPGLADIPYLGVPFRKTLETQNEVELLIMVTPEFAEAMEPEDVPTGVPGLNSCSPSDHELYLKGYIEVPATGDPNCNPGQSCPQEVFTPQGVRSQSPNMIGPSVVPNGAPVMAAPPYGAGSAPMNTPVPDASARYSSPSTINGRPANAAPNVSAPNTDRTAIRPNTVAPVVPRR